ncbi:MAG: bifunctional hydroxymethylpyrimidine kinase/phosphomethylpyrimidine kinase [Verrucomicrobiota bacterium]|nr:bifunctional hydroxymethylpyrimidine kinase/phosphomethylpyrimidine kinase [Verrucomicrobiota bacterium]
MKRPPRVALTIAGSDSSAGAGLQADLKTFAARGVYGLTAVTCIVAEIPGKVTRMQPAEPSLVREQIALLLKNFPVRATKTGLLANAQIVSAVSRALRGHREIPLVVDPVMVATSGDLLLTDDAIRVYECSLFPLATLLTPNLDEAERLLGDPIRGVRGLRAAAIALHEKYGVSILLKGGHLRGREALDVLVTKRGTHEYRAPFIAGVSTHGTGCTFSAAITAELARGASLPRAVAKAKQIVSAAIRDHFAWKNARGAKLHALNHSAAR